MSFLATSKLANNKELGDVEFKILSVAWSRLWSTRSPFVKMAELWVREPTVLWIETILTSAPASIAPKGSFWKNKIVLHELHQRLLSYLSYEQD